VNTYATKQQIAQSLRVSVRTVDRMSKQGMPHVRIGRLVRYVPSAVENWLDRNGGKGGGRNDKRIK
jgi:excisionase family DNA binding protein